MCSLLLIGPHSRPAPVWRPDPATSRSTPLGRAGTGPVGHPGEKEEGTAEEPCQVDFRRLLLRRIKRTLRSVI